MKALTFQSEGEVKVTDVPKPSIKGSGDALVKVTLGAVCGSDLHILHGHTPINQGAVLGHEVVGVIEEVGGEVKRFKPGDRVVASFFTSCGHCALCRKGWFNQCVEKATFGFGEYFGDLGGGQAEYVVVPNADHSMEPIPVAMSDEQAIFVVDMVDARLEMAQGLGGIPINASQVHPVEAIQGYTGGIGADASIECVGLLSAVDTAIQSVRGGGTISMLGVPSAVLGDFPYMQVWMKALTFRAGWCNVQAYMRPLLDLIAAGRLKPDSIISHRMKLDDAEEAYRIFDAREATKIVLRP